MLEGRDKKGEFVETNSSEYSISKIKIQVMFETAFASHRVKFQNKSQHYLNNLSTNEIEGKL